MLNVNRYGRRIRKLVNEALRNKNKRYECPKCGKIKVKRRGSSKWECSSCGAVIAGGAYTLTTAPGETAKRIIESKIEKI